MKVLAIVLGFVLLTAGILLGIEAVGILLLGWVMFLARVLPNIHPDGRTAVTGGIAILLFAIGVHLLGRRYLTSWRLRWSGMVLATVGVLFAVGISMIGIAHQVGWLATTQEPLRAEGYRGWDPWGGNATGRNNQKQIGLGISNYHDAWSHLPPGGSFAPDGTGKHGWFTHIMIHIPYSNSGIDMDQPWNSPRNRENFQCVIPQLMNPGFRTAPLVDSEGFGLAHYAANSRVMGRNTQVRLEDLPSGGATIALVGEVDAGFRPWGHPENWRDPSAGLSGGPRGFGNPARTGAHFAMGDGSVRFFSKSTDPEVLEAIAGPKRR